MVLSCNKALFKKDALTLPGLLRQTYRYSQISRITLAPSLQTISLELAQGQKAKTVKLKIVGISKESAATLWTQFALKIRHAEIENDVRDRLLSSTTSSKFVPRQLMASGERASQIASTSIALTLDLKEHSKSLRLNSYLRAFTKVALHGWTILWLGIGLFIAFERLTSVHDPGMRNSVFELLNCLARAYGFPIQAIVQFSNTVMGQTVAAASLLIALSVFTVIYLAKAKEPNLLALDETGFALYRKDTFDERLLGRVLWADIKSVKMLVPQNASGKLKNSSIEIETLNSDYRGPAIVIPLRSLANQEKRKQFLHLLNSVGETIEIDDRVLLNLEPRRDDTYTSLWLNALGKAPELGNLIPLVAGQELRHSLIIEKQFASGGQAVTYLASRAQQPNTKVILKEFLLPLFVEAAEHRARERFERAAKLLQSLEHPKIVKLQEYFIEGHRAFLVLDYIDGQNLKQVVTVKGKQTEEAVVNFASQMSIILSYLHSCTPPIVHRDFTAENLILTSSGELRLIDFDVALEVDQINEQTKMAGKTHYIPPEQFRGNPCPQSDIYAMGATLFYILTAIEPEPLQVNSPKNYTSEISDELNQFVEKCTEPELANRYKNIDAALQALNLMKSI